ncbi:MAG: M1 family peptidase [Deltaproteobacteria bacterium]|nr:MAG: M1 family peptidase [Deltaproteobacteria bacterium]
MVRGMARSLRIPFVAAAVAAAACGGTGRTSPHTAPATPAAPPQSTAAPATAPAPSETPKPPAFRLPDTAAPVSYTVELTLDPAKSTFDGEVTIEVDLRDAATALWLNGRDLDVRDVAVTAGDRAVSASVIDEHDDDVIGLQFGEPVGPGRATVRIAYTGKVSDTDLSGVFRQKEVDDWYLYTQFEAIDARRAFPCFDEPHHKTPWQITIRAPKGQEAFANTPEVDRADDGDWVVHRFAPSKPLPSYLVAFAVGPFDIVDAGKAGRNETPVRILVPKGRSADARFAVEATGPILTALEDYFDIPYPYEKLDQIAVPNFFGAMENPGLITYAQSALLRAPNEETPEFYRRYAGIAAHEMAHQWFGDLVTMKWWDDLWLNESFATWMAAKIVAQWKPEWSTGVYVVQQRERAMAADALPTAKPIRQPVTTRADVFGGNSAIIYAKGSAVLNTFETWIGQDAFRDGIRAYIRDHAWGNATADDLFAAIAAQSSSDLAAAFRTFVDQPGYPLVTAELSCDAGAQPALRLSQRRYVPEGADAPAITWQVPVCAVYEGGRDCTLMTEATATLPLSRARSCPTWVLANDDAAGYYRVAYTGDLLRANLLGPGARKLSLNERMMLIGDAAALVDAGALAPADVLALLPKVLRKDDNPHIVRSTVRIVQSIDTHLVPDQLRANYARFVRKLYGKRAARLGFTPRKSEDDDTRMLRPTLLSLVAVQGQDARLVRRARSLADAWLAGRATIAPDLVGTVLTIAARGGDRAFYDRLLDEAKATKDRTRRGHLLAAMAAFTDPDLVRRNLDLMLGDTFDLREAAVFLQAPLANPATREYAYQFVKDHYDEVMKKLPAFYARFVVYIAGAFCDDAHRDDARAFFEPRVATIMGGKTALDQVTEQVHICSVQRAAQQPAIAKFLAKW